MDYNKDQSPLNDIFEDLPSICPRQNDIFHKSIKKIYLFSEDKKKIIEEYFNAINFKDSNDKIVKFRIELAPPIPEPYKTELSANLTTEEMDIIISIHTSLQKNLSSTPKIINQYHKKSLNIIYN